MILTHPDNLKLFEDCQAIAKEGGGGHPFLPLDAMEIRTDRLIPATRKTGRLIWPQDPFVTYEESDRQWGVALGIAKEEEEPLFYDMGEFQPILDELAAESSRQFLEDFEQAMMQRWNIPSQLLGESNFAGSYGGPSFIIKTPF